MKSDEELREEKRAASWPMQIMGCVIALLLSGVAGGLAGGFLPFYLAFDNTHDRNTRYSTTRQEQAVNDAAVNFKWHVYAGVGIGLLAGGLLWYRVTRKEPPKYL